MTTTDNDGVRCLSCGMTARECIRDWKLTDQWCCPDCANFGPAAMHRHGAVKEAGD